VATKWQRPPRPARFASTPGREVEHGEEFTAEGQEVKGLERQDAARPEGVQEGGRQALRRHPAEVLSPAVEVRQYLAGARAAGIDFDSAWDEALAALQLDATEDAGPAERREVEAWRAALHWSRPFFEAAYCREPERRREHAARALEGMAA